MTIYLQMISMEKYEISYISNRKHLQIKSHFCISKEELSLRQSRKLEKEGFCWILSIVQVQLLCFKYNNFYLKLFFFFCSSGFLIVPICGSVVMY